MTSNDDLLVNHGGLETLSAEMHRSSSDSSSDLDAMDAELRPTQSGWSGEAQQQYTIAMAQCRDAISRQQMLTQQLGTHVSTSRGDYQSTDQTAAGAFT